MTEHTSGSVPVNEAVTLEVQDPQVQAINTEIAAINSFLNRSRITTKIAGVVTVLSLSAAGLGAYNMVHDANKSNEAVVACERVHPGQDAFCEAKSDPSKDESLLLGSGIMGTFGSVLYLAMNSMSQQSAISTRRYRRRELNRLTRS